jgi:hypothetical protein
MFTPGNGLVDEAGAFVAYRPGSYQVTASFGNRTGDAVVAAVDRDIKRPLTVVGKLVRSAFHTSEVWIHPNGNVAYLGTIMGGDRVYAVDISNPANPTVVDSIIVNARSINDIMTTPDGNTLVITREGAADRKNGIVIADTHDPLHPKALRRVHRRRHVGVHSAFVHQQPKYGTQVYLTNDGTGALHVSTSPIRPTRSSSRRGKTPRADAGRMLHDIDVQHGWCTHRGGTTASSSSTSATASRGARLQPAVRSQYKYDLDALYTTSRPRAERDSSAARTRRGATRTTSSSPTRCSATRRRKRSTPADLTRARAPAVLDVRDIEHLKPLAWYEPEFGGVHNVWVAGDTLYVGAYNAGFKAFDICGEVRGDLKAQGRMIGESCRRPEGQHPERADDVGRRRQQEGRPGLRERLQQRAVDGEDRAEAKARTVSAVSGWWGRTAGTRTASGALASPMPFLRSHIQPAHHS